MTTTPSELMWVCDACDTRVGCHPGTHVALGKLADRETRAARQDLHRFMDPLWEQAVNTGGYTEEEKRRHKSNIRAVARTRIYAFLEFHMGLSRSETHIAMFSLEQCLEARKILEGKEYLEIRRWAQKLKRDEQLKRRIAKLAENQEAN